MQDTIFKVKADLGLEAIIINTRKFKRGGLFGLFGKSQVEVLAALEEKKEKNSDNNTLKEINELKNLINDLNKRWNQELYIKDLPDKLAVIYSHLSNQGTCDEFCNEFIGKVNSIPVLNESKVEFVVENKLKQFIGKCQPIQVEEDQQKVVAFIGPTGVGKTTTIAKLAAKFALDEEKDVALITADTYRIAAVQQLQTYSDIMNIPLQVVYNRKELDKNIQGSQKYDLILIDTAGSSWNDSEQIDKLCSILASDLIDEIHLLVGLNTKSQDIKGIIEKFSKMNPDKILLTKLDETGTFGDIINIKYNFKFPYSYITYGQDVPNDIKIAEPQTLVQYILGDYNG